jgi:hypothetical protein
VCAVWLRRSFWQTHFTSAKKNNREAAKLQNFFHLNQQSSGKTIFKLTEAAEISIFMRYLFGYTFGWEFSHFAEIFSNKI